VPLHQDFNYTPYGLMSTPAISMHDFPEDLRRDSVTTDGSVFTHSSGHSPTEPNYLADAVTPEDTAINHDVVFACAFNGNGSNVFQQPTPAMTAYDNFDTSIDFTRPLFPINTTATAPAVVPHLSPGAQPDVTLYSPQVMQVDEGFSDGFGAYERPSGDFTLFSDPAPNNMAFSNSIDMFPDMSSVGGQFDTSQFHIPSEHLSAAFDDLCNTTNFGNNF
jgi:hypothetical protein